MIKAGTATPGLKLGATTIARAYVGATLVLGTAPAFSHVISAGTNTDTIAVPTEAAAGDLAVIFDFAANPQPSDTTPSGWTQLQTVTMTLGVGHRVSVYAKYLVSGDLSTSVTGLNSGSEGKAIFIMRNAGTVFAAAGAQSVSETSTDPGSITITPAGGSHPLLFCCVKYTYGGTSAFSSGTFDVTQTAGNSTTGSIIAGLKYQSADSNSFTFDSADNGNAQLQAGFYLTID